MLDIPEAVRLTKAWAARLEGRRKATISDDDLWARIVTKYPDAAGWEQIRAFDAVRKERADAR